MKILRRSIAACAIALIIPIIVARGFAATNEPKAITVFAAASLTDVLQQIGPLYTQASGVPVKFSFAASSALARQVEAGARAQVFISADQEWMDYLDERQLIDRASRRDLLGNRLALIAPRDSPVSLKLDSPAALPAAFAAALGPRGRLSTGDPDSVPAGKYARSALAALHLWDAMAPRLVRADNVRVALMYVARGEAPLGIVYSTDAAVEAKVKIVDLFPESTHAPITYPAAALAGAAGEAGSFLAFLHGDTARRLFLKAGFTVIGAGP